MKISNKLAFALIWNDYCPGEAIIGSRRGIGIFDVGVDYVKKACEDFNVKNIFRGHGHNGSVVSYLYGYDTWRSVAVGKEINLSASDQFVYTICYFQLHDKPKIPSDQG